MTWNDFFQSIQAEQPARVYVFSGEEEWIKREALEALKEKLLPPGLEQLNYAVLEDADSRQIIEAAETLPMMSDYRMIVVRDWAPLLPGKSKNEDAEIERMKRWLEHPPETSVVVFYLRSEPDNRKKALTELKKHAECIAFDPLSDAELAKWVQKRLKSQGKRMRQPALNALTFMVGRDLTRLSGELEKLAAFVGDRDEITDGDVREIVAASLEYNVFELLNHLLDGDIAAAQKMVNSLLQGGQTSVGLLALLTRQLRQLVHMRYALDGGEPVEKVQAVLKMHPYAAKQTARQCRKRSAEVLRAVYEDCVRADFEIKSGQLRDRAALDAILLKIAVLNLAQSGN